MYTVTTDIDFDREVSKVVKMMKETSATLKEVSDEDLTQKVYKYLMTFECVDLEDIVLKTTTEVIENKFKCKKEQDKFKIIYNHKSDKVMYQKRILSVQEEFKKEFPNIKMFIIDKDNNFNYVLYVKNKRLFNSKKFKDFCKKVKYKYEEIFGEVNYIVKLKED